MLSAPTLSASEPPVSISETDMKSEAFFVGQRAGCREAITDEEGLDEVRRLISESAGSGGPASSLIGQRAKGKGYSVKLTRIVVLNIIRLVHLLRV